MKENVTLHISKYPIGKEPDFWCPEEYKSFRFLLGKSGNNPFVAICMNPSAAREESSDRTINRVIKVGTLLGYDGWTVINTYPERATDAVNMNDFDEKLAEQNIIYIKEYLEENNIKEVWGAWGDLNYIALQNGKSRLLELFEELNIRIFYFGTLTKRGNPRHPLQRQEKWEISNNNKKYLDITEHL